MLAGLKTLDTQNNSLIIDLSLDTQNNSLTIDLSKGEDLDDN